MLPDFLDILDIILVAFIIFQVYYLIKGTVAIRIFLGILAIYIIWKLVTALQMEMLGELLGQFIGVGVIAVIIVFQQELRQFLLYIGNRGVIKGEAPAFLKKYFFKNDEEDSRDFDALLKACIRMSASKTGALIAISNKSDVENYVKSQLSINAEISQALIESIFYKNSPLHDGCMVLKDSKISSARGVLPVSENQDLDPNLGMRHRAALGISEITDCYVIVVSEESGIISLAHDSKLIHPISIKELKEIISKPI